MLDILFPKIETDGLTSRRISIWGLVVLLSTGPTIYWFGIGFFNLLNISFDASCELLREAYRSIIDIRFEADMISENWAVFPRQRTFEQNLLYDIYWNNGKIVFSAIFVAAVSLLSAINGHPVFVKMIAGLLFLFSIALLISNLIVFASNLQLLFTGCCVVCVPISLLKK